MVTRHARVSNQIGSPDWMVSPALALAPADRVPITVVMPTLNEAAVLTQALANLQWADEVIVVDGGSADNSVDVARVGGARVLIVAGRTIAAQRNAGIAAARNH